MSKAAASSPPDSEDLAKTRSRGIGLCLSGGGFRATLFHAGAIQRLFELGVVSRPDFHTVAAVSGGSIASALWAVAVARAEAENRALDYVRDIRLPLQALATTDIRTGVVARKLLFPWNWFRGAYAVNGMVSRFEAAFGKIALSLLPADPRFIFCGTDMAFGASFTFERDRVGSYLAGYARPEEFTLAEAVAASACFPPLFGPLRIDRAAQRFKGGRASGLTAGKRKRVLEDIRVTDGGVYDNLGLEPVWKSHRMVLVSDAGGLMDAEADRNFFWRVRRYQSIQEAQSRALRKRFLISGFAQGTIAGAYIGVSSAPSRYAGAREAGYTKAFAREVISLIRTDLDAFSEVEQGVLINHGYALMDAALRTHAQDGIATDTVFAWPFPGFAPDTTGEDELRRRLEGSQNRKLAGRG